MSEYSYVGTGKIYLRKRGAAAPLRAVGNASALNISTTEKVIDLQNRQTPGGGLDDQVRRIEKATTSMVLHDLSPKNWELATLGTSSVIAAAAVVDEVVIAYKGGLARLANLPDPAIALVVTNSGATVTYAEGVDYLRTASGFVPTLAGGIADAQSLKVDYTKRAGNVIQALVESASSYQMVFEGLNEAKSGRPAVVDIHNVKLGAAQTIALLGDEFGQFEIPGEILIDDTIVATGVSQYFKAELASV